MQRLARFPRLPDLLILALAAVMRFWRLGYHSIWFDEAISLQWAGYGLGYTWRTTFALVQEKHPPLYYITLGVWQRLLEPLGLAHSDIALRALGATLGVLTVAATLGLARQLSGAATGRLAALLVARSPVLVWYSPEMRMFQPATTALVGSGYCLMRAWQAPQRAARLGWWLAFVGATVAALYTYLYSAFLLPAMGLTLLTLNYFESQMDVDKRRFLFAPLRLRVKFLEGVAALVIITLLFLPLAFNAWRVNAAESAAGRPFADLGGTLLRQLRTFTIWRVEWPSWLAVVTLSLLVILFTIGLIWPYVKINGQKNRVFPRISASKFPLDQFWLLLWLGIPLLIGNLLLASNATIFREDRYFLYLAPFALWAIARGVVIVSQRVRAVGVVTGVLAVLIVASALPRLWSPAMLREDWRAAARYIVAQQEANPALQSTVIAHIGYTHPALEWYLRQAFDFDALPLYHPWEGPLPAQMSDADIEAEIAPPLRGLISVLDAKTVWLVQRLYSGEDDGRLVEGWLADNFPLLTEQYPAGLKLTGYALQSEFDALPALTSSASEINADLAPGLALAACEITTPRVSATEPRLGRAGWVHVRLWWRATGEIGENYEARVPVVDGAGGEWGGTLERDGRRDNAMAHFPTGTWQPGIFARDEHDVNLNPQTPSGEYAVTVDLLDETGAVAGQAACGAVEID